jgi:ABC-type transport system involved in multi-copper enzyme maturation permease subunit
MRDALHFFRKDVRHLWPGILPVLAVTALEGWMNATFATAIQLPMAWLWILSCAYLGASAIQEERLPGHEQYWLTRPIARWRLLLAKVLFLVVFLALPQLVAQALALLVNGISPLRHVGGLLCTGLLFSMAIGLAVAALASVTESLLRFLYALLALAGIEILGVVLAGPGTWGSLEWIRESAIAAVVLAAAVTVLILQYARRQTTWARGVVAVAIALVAGAPFADLWSAAFTIQSTFRYRVNPSGLRIAFDSMAHGPKSYSIGAYSPRLREEGIAIPIVVTGIPSGAAVISERIAAAIDAPGGQSWRSPWTETGGLAGMNPLEDERVIRADGPVWQYLNVDPAFYRAVKDTPADLHTSVALTLIGAAQSAPLAGPGPLGGRCTVQPGPRDSLIVICAWPLGSPARAYIHAKSLESLLRPSGSYSPYPTDGSLWHRAATAFSAPPEPLELTLETWQAVAHFERHLDIPAIRLRDYVVRRVTE